MNFVGVHTFFQQNERGMDSLSEMSGFERWRMNKVLRTAFSKNIISCIQELNFNYSNFFAGFETSEMSILILRQHS